MSESKTEVVAYLQDFCCPQQRTSSARPAISEKCQKGKSQHLDDSHDYVCLNFGSNLAASVYVRDLGRGVVGCGLKLACISGFDLVA